LPGLLEILDPKRTWADLGGQTALKQYLDQAVLAPLRAADPADRALVPTVILLMGPPGTGQTALVEALAATAGINCVIFAPGNLLGAYVGQSERNLERALAALRTLAPCVVFVDEIDTALRRGGEGDSGVGARLFGCILAFVSDPALRGQILWYGAANFPQLCDPALIRPGRFGDCKVAVLPPAPDERATIFAIYLAKYGLPPDARPPDAVAQTEGYTGADIEQVVRKAAERVRWQGEAPADALTTALALVIPPLGTTATMIAEALSFTDDLSMLHPVYQAQARALRQAPPSPAADPVPVPAAALRGPRAWRGAG
jgi:SpoVK/Ycf46/Vps4 family AAA+-type ATPase